MVTESSRSGTDFTSTVVFDPATPFHLVLPSRYVVTSDSGGSIWLGTGNTTNGPSVRLAFAAGDAAANQVTSVTIATPTQSQTVGPVAWPSGVSHTLALHFDGSDLSVTIDGTPVATLVAADMSTADGSVYLHGQVTDAAESMRFASIAAFQSA